MNNTLIRCPVWGVVVGAACLLLTAFLAGCGESGGRSFQRAPPRRKPPRVCAADRYRAGQDRRHGLQGG